MDVTLVICLIVLLVRYVTTKVAQSSKTIMTQKVHHSIRLLRLTGRQIAPPPSNEKNFAYSPACTSQNDGGASVHFVTLGRENNAIWRGVMGRRVEVRAARHGPI